MKILFVDDNEDSRVLAKGILESQGITVECAGNGGDAVDKAKSMIPDLILSDIMMPGVDGFEFCRRVKSDEQLRNIPVVLITVSYTEPENQELARNVGASRLIIKPTDTDSYIRTINEVLNEFIKEELEVVEKPLLNRAVLDQMHFRSVADKLEKKLIELDSMTVAVQQSEEKYRRLVEGLRGEYFFYTYGADGVFTYLSPSVTDVLGYSNEEFLKHFTTFLTDNPINDKFRQHSYSVVKEEQQMVYEVEVYHRDGGIVWLEIKETLIVDEHGKEMVVEGLAHDITERRRIVETLRESEEKFRYLFNSINDAIFVYSWNPDMKPGFFMEINDVACERLGYSRDELLKMNMKMITAPEMLSQAPFGMNDESGAGRAIFESVHLTKDGTPVSVEISTNLFNYKGDQIVIAIARDITGRKRLEEQLLHAQKMEAVGLLAGGVAHDFNNILSAIVNYTYIMKKRSNDRKELIDYTDNIFSLATRASDITRSLLAFSRKHFISPVPVALNDSVKKVEKLLSKFIGEDIEVRIKLTDKDTVIIADNAQMDQIMMNFATNARDAMPNGGCLSIETDIKVIDDKFIKAQGFGKAGTYVQMTVADTGIGMDQETREKAFEPFFTTKEFGKGTGLGLSVVYGIVKQHNGYITVSSKPGEGTVFRVFLPLSERAVVKQEPPVFDSLDGRGETILLAEDEIAVRQSEKSILESVGYKVIEAVDGNDAVNKFRDNRDNIDITILDVIMPKKNGREAYEEIRAIRPGTKVIFTSGYAADLIEKDKLFDEDMIFIAKPVSPENLLSKIRDVLQRQS